MKIVFAAVVSLLSLAGCASQIMQGYIGQDVREVMLDYGPPANAFDMGDGRRAFQWVMQNSYSTPTTASSTARVNNYGYSTWVTTNTTITEGRTVNSKCVYTLFGRWSEERKG